MATIVHSEINVCTWHYELFAAHARKGVYLTAWAVMMAEARKSDGTEMFSVDGGNGDKSWRDRGRGIYYYRWKQINTRWWHHHQACMCRQGHPSGPPTWTEVLCQPPTAEPAPGFWFPGSCGISLAAHLAKDNDRHVTTAKALFQQTSSF